MSMLILKQKQPVKFEYLTVEGLWDTSLLRVNHPDKPEKLSEDSYQQVYSYHLGVKTGKFIQELPIVTGCSGR